MSRPPLIASTADWPLREEWTSRVRLIPRSRFLWPLAARVFRAGLNADAMILDGGAVSPRPHLRRPGPGEKAKNAEMIALMALARRSHPPKVVLTEATWRFGSGLGRAARSVVVRAVDRAVSYYCVHSEEERQLLIDAGLAPERVIATPYYYTVDLDGLPSPTRDGSVFAGGFTHRDWPTMIEAVRGLEAPVTIATPAALHGLPPNVTAGRLSADEFNRRMMAASVVVIPMPPGLAKSAGLQTVLNAMALGKPVIVSDVPGVRAHVDDGRTGLVVPPGDPASLRRAIESCLTGTMAESLAERGRAEALARFAPERYVDTLLTLTQKALGRDPEIAQPVPG